MLQSTSVRTHGNTTREAEAGGVGVVLRHGAWYHWRPPQRAARVRAAGWAVLVGGTSYCITPQVTVGVGSQPASAPYCRPS